MSDVLLGQGYFLRFDPKLWKAQQPYPPLGTLYAAACLRAEGHAVALFDAMLARSVDEWGDSLRATRPRFAVLCEDSFNYLSKMCLLRMREASLAMLRMARQAGAVTVACGSDVTDNPQPYLEAGADYVVRGEAEQTLVELLGALGGRGTLAVDAVRGVSRRGADGSVVHAAPRPPLREIDALPLPAWDLVDMARYRALWRARHGYHSLNLVTTRGCPYHCNWCAKPIYGQRYAVRSPAGVADEMAWLKQRYAPDHFAFCDDIFGLRPGWVEAFADEVGRRGVATPFKCLSRADLLGAAVVRALAAAGCRMVWIGAESGSQRILDAMEKGIRVEQIREAARRLRAAGIGVGFFLQFGYPGEGREDIERTFELVRECRPDDIGVSVSYPLPGTRFHDRVSGQLGARQNWKDSDDLAMLYQGPFPTAFYRALHAVLHKEFRLLRPSGPRRIRDAAARLYARATLGLARRRLERLAEPQAGANETRPDLSPDEAARPTEQAS